MTDLATRRPFTAIPPGRFRWRMALCRRNIGGVPEQISDCIDARSRRLTTTLNKGAEFSFSVDGHSPTARLARELECEIMLWRWDEGWDNASEVKDRPTFRGVITASQDTLSEQRHTVNFTCHDYFTVLDRRYLTRPLDFNPASQDGIAEILVLMGADQNFITTSSGYYAGAAARLPISFVRCFPDGSLGRPDPLRQRDRNYVANKSIGEALAQLSEVIDGFDLGVIYAGWGTPATFDASLGSFYPYRGVERNDWAFEYGSTVTALSRTVSSTDYANYWRVTGQSGEGEPQLWAEGWNNDVTDLISNPAGAWMGVDAMSDVSDVQTLHDRVAYLLQTNGIMIPSYSLTLRPGAFSHDAFGLGDTVRLRIRSGRLDVNNWVRVQRINYVIGDDGQEDIEVEVGRPAPSFVDLLRGTNGRVAALERR